VGYILTVTVAVSAFLSVNTLEFDSAFYLFSFFVVFALISTLNQKGSAVTGVVSCGATGLVSHKVVFEPFQGRSQASPERVWTAGYRHRQHH
jgi:hypothetical protein